MIPKSLRWLFLWLLLAIILRLWGLGSQSLTVDEIGEFDIANLSVATLVNYPNSFPPLYHLIAKATLLIYDHPLSLRWLSLVFGVCSIAVTWQLVRANLNDRTANAVGLLLAVSPFHIYYSQEARAYSMYLLMATIGGWAFLRVLRRGSSVDWSCFIVASTIGMLTHYYYGIFLAVAGVVLFVSRGVSLFRPPHLLWGIALIAGCVPAFLLVPGDFRFQHDLRVPRPLNAPAFAYTYFSMFSGYALGPSQPELHEMDPRDAIRQATPWVALLLAALFPLAWAGHRSLDTRTGWVVLAFAFGPVLLIGLLGAATGITYNTRFVVWCSLPVLVWLAAGLAGEQRFYSRAAFVALLVVQTVALANRHFDPRYANEDIASLAEHLRGSVREDTPILICSDYMFRPIQFYLGAEWRLIPVLAPEAGTESSVHAKPIGDIALGSYFLAYVREFHGDPDAKLLTHLREVGSLEPVAEFPGIRLFRGGANQDQLTRSQIR